MNTHDNMKTCLLESASQDTPREHGSKGPNLTETPAVDTPASHGGIATNSDKEIDEFIDNPMPPSAVEDFASIEEEEEKEEEEEEEEISENAAMWGAAGAGCGVGYAIGGFVLAVLGGAGGAYAATKEGKVGDAARSSGRVVVAAGRKAKKFNEKHKVTERAMAACSAAFNSAKEMNEKHKITERTGKALKGGYEQAKSFNDKHQITTKVASAAATGMKTVENVVVNKKQSAAAEDSPTIPDGLPVIASQPIPAGVAPTESHV